MMRPKPWRGHCIGCKFTWDTIMCHEDAHPDAELRKGEVLRPDTCGKQQGRQESRETLVRHEWIQIVCVSTWSPLPSVSILALALDQAVL